MVLAVAGLNLDAITDRTRLLASGDWSSFSPAEQAAFRFARKQALDPAAVTAEDRRQLVRHFGSDRALDVIWWSCRCHYKNCVADAFQLPLERENVFDGFRTEGKVSRGPK
jgi:alkylhydroperoxidase family enzyme